MTIAPRYRCWQPTPADTLWLARAERLYTRALAAEERIPWGWIERCVIEHDPSPGEWRKHLILIAIGEEVAGLVFGAFVPGFGGYLCYVAVDERFRKLGLASRLYDAFYEQMRLDASACGEPLPFVIWESHRPENDPKLWTARTKLFRAVGGELINGLTLMSPNYCGGSPVPLQVFLKPFDEPRDAFDTARLCQVAADLLDRVYGEEPGDPLYDATFACSPAPHLAQPTYTPPGIEPGNASKDSSTSPAALSTVTLG